MSSSEPRERSRPIRVSGTGTEYDQEYYPDSIVRCWSWDQGYVMRVRAKNHLPVDEVLV